MPTVLAPRRTAIVTLANSDRDSAPMEPTVASVWQAAAGVAIGDDLLEWPPDLFALTEVTLQRSEAYRFALSPPAGSTWPPAGVQDWPDAVTDAARRWSAWVEDRSGALPRLLEREWGIFRARAGIPIDQLARARDWQLCQALLTLHAIADEACAGLGIALDASGEGGVVYRARGRELLARTGSLARIAPHLIRVLPKVRTPPNGSSLRSLSRYAAAQAPGVKASWHKARTHRPSPRPHADGVNFLLLPWPLRVRASDFRPVPGPLQKLANDPFGFFEFVPSERLDLDLVDRMLVAALDEVDAVDVVILPESAVERGEIDDLEAVLDRHAVTGLITGVREHVAQPGQLPGNWVHIGVSACEYWVHIRQSKHHRWSLDQAQISQYNLGSALHPHVRWWEAMEVPRRSVQFVELGDGITLASLVCEDLAQADEVASVIRSVGPMIVVTPLLDGPQLSSRWGARYASVLADDPGSAVLTLTAFGMAQRSRVPGRDSSPVVALWKGPGQGTREIPLEPGAQGILLSASADRAVRRSFDGRRPVENGSEFFDVSVHQVQAASTGSGQPASPAGSATRPMLKAGELTILTSWAEAAAEALAFTPQCVEALRSDARAGAAWRAELQIPEPSPQLYHAIAGLMRAVRAAATAGACPALDAPSHGRPDGLRGERDNERLVRAVLRSALEQRQTRLADQSGTAAPNSLCRPEVHRWSRAATRSAEAATPSGIHGAEVLSSG